MPDTGREAYWFGRLAATCGDELRGLVRRDLRPDFLVERDGRVVGVELTEFQLPVAVGRRPRREVGSLRRAVVEAAKQISESHGLPPVAVTVRFTEGYTKQIDRKGLALSIARAVSRHAHAADPPFVGIDVPWDELPEEIDEVEITRLPAHIDSYWHAPSWQWVAPVAGHQITAQVDRKARQLADARRKCDALWLVIVNDIFTGGEAVDLPAGTSGQTSHALLDRLYWLDPVGPRAVRLQ